VLDSKLEPALLAQPGDLARVLGGGAAKHLDGDLRSRAMCRRRTPRRWPPDPILLVIRYLPPSAGAGEITRGRRGFAAARAAFERRDPMLVERPRRAVAVQPVERATMTPPSAAQFPAADAHRESTAGTSHGAAGERGAGGSSDVATPGDVKGFHVTT